MRLSQYQVDAFTRTLFTGNPAAVVPLDHWLPDSMLQAIADENNLSETAFFVPEGDGYRLRWFTPVAEVDLCGHATLAAAHVLYHHAGYTRNCILFHTRSGLLTVRRHDAEYTLDFPASFPVEVPCPDALAAALPSAPLAVLAAEDYLVVLADAHAVRQAAPDMIHLRQLDRRGVILTAPGEDCDFVSRFFAPKFGIDEDPVTGSAHCQLTPYWSERLNRKTLSARQISRRGGELRCELVGHRVLMSGQAVTFLESVLHLPETA